MLNLLSLDSEANIVATIRYLVTDVERSTAFYTNALGFVGAEHGSGLCSRLQTTSLLARRIAEFRRSAHA